MQQLKDFYKKYDYFFVTLKKHDTEDFEEKAYFISDPGRNPLKFVLNAFQGLFIILKERPKIVVSTGAGMAIPLCYMAKILGRKIVFIESFCRIEEPSITGKIVYPVADVFLVQWKEQLKKYGKKAKYHGGVF
jgi:UDP-N-acetylglucosamine:LPS N-acetylglucosamine transferase